MLKKDFPSATKKDIRKICSEINNSDYSEWTKMDYKVILKRFYKWLREEEGQKLGRRGYPDEVEWISTTMKKNRKKLPDELLTIEDVKKLAEAANNLRDRCFVLVLYESGGRIGEVTNIKLKDIENDKFGCKIKLSGKTGQRKIRLISSAPSISNWLIDHPDRHNKESMLFCGIWSKKRGEMLDYQTYRDILKKLAKKAGITKPSNPHHFRHSRATELSKVFTEAQLCQYMGWVQGSKEAATYVHLSGRDMDQAVLKMHGLAEEETEDSKFKPIICPRCNTKNDPAAKFCSGCSLGLDIKTTMNFEKTKGDITSSLVDLIKDKDQALETLEALTKLLQNQDE